MVGLKGSFKKDKSKLFCMEQPRVHSETTVCVCHLENQTNCQSTSYPQLEFEMVNYISLTDTLDFTAEWFLFSFPSRGPIQKTKCEEKTELYLERFGKCKFAITAMAIWSVCACAPTQAQSHLFCWTCFHLYLHPAVFLTITKTSEICWGWHTINKEILVMASN